MARPSTKKRKEAPQNGSLLAFFSAASAAKKGRVQTDVAPASEVIIIDSDDEDNPTNPNGGECLFKTTACDPAHSSSSSSNAGPTDRECAPTFGKPSTLLLADGPPLQEALCPVPPNALHSSCKMPGSATSIFGVASSLLRTALTPQPLPCGNDSKADSCDRNIERSIPSTTSDCQVPQQSTLTTWPVGVDAAEFSRLGSEEWDAGDDELVPETFDREVGNHIEGNPDGVLSGLCPICGRELSGVSEIELQDHVNKCLDLASSPNGVAELGHAHPPESSDSNNREGAPNLFSVLMSSCRENQMWKEADGAGDHNSKPTRTSGNRRKAPFYKVLQGMPIAVDAFRYGTIPGVSAYFLTHAHSDHYTNLASSWKSGPIYCSEGTANLIIHMLTVDRKWVHPLPMNTPTVIPDTDGVRVTLIEANHCPGSCLFFFEGPQTVNAGDSVYTSPFVGSPKTFRYLHCGDFRASPQHVLHPAIRGKHIDHIYLDTTYLDPKYVFPPQPQVIYACAELARRIVAGEPVGPIDANGKRDTTIHEWVNSRPQCEREEKRQAQGRTLVAIGTYSIGKERIVKAVAQALQAKIYCDERKMAILLCQNDQQLHDLLTSDPLEGGIHLLPLGLITSDKLQSYVQRFGDTFSRVIGFRPTGWSYIPPVGNNPNPTIPVIVSQGQTRSFSYTDLRLAQKATYAVQLYGVPYSEHSSFFELTCFAMSCDWSRIIPTVSVGSEKGRAKMALWIQRWEAERKRGKISFIEPRAADYW